MKKFIVLSLAGLLILAFGATAYAQAPKLEFKASGFIDMQSFMGVNVPQYQAQGTGLYGAANTNWVSGFGGYGLGGPGWNRTDTHWEARAHLKFDAIMGPNLSGTIYFEIDTLRWGAPFNNYPGGAGGASGIAGMGREANNFGAWTTDRTAVEVKNIYIDVGLPYFGIPVPMTMRIGAQTLGIRPGILMVSDGMGITGGIKIDPVLIAPMYAKALEGRDFTDDDVDVWGLNVSAKLGTFTVGGYGLYWRMNSYPLYVTSVVAGLTSTLNPAVAGTNAANIWWLGVYADGKAGPVNLNFDFVYDNGKVQEKLHPSPYNRDVSYQGWATRTKVDFPWEKFNFGAVGMYATGGDTRSTSATGMPGTATSLGQPSRNFSGYVVPPGSEQGPANGESVVVYSMEPGATGGYGIAERANYAGLGPGAFGGTWFAKLYASAKITPWYKITLHGLYIGDTTKHGNTFGTALKYPGVSSLLLRDDKDIGWEFDLIQDFQIYNALRFNISAGYLIAGDALDIRQNTTLLNRSPQNPWAIKTRLFYTF